MNNKYKELAKKLYDWLNGYNDEKLRVLNTEEICNDCGNAAVAIEKLLQENKILEERLGHLLKSEIIREYDAHDAVTHDYKLDIEELDRIGICGAVERHLLAEPAIALEFERDEPERIEKPAAGEDVLYICDRRACTYCAPTCNHTPNISHAKHFVRTSGGYMSEVEAE